MTRVVAFTRFARFKTGAEYIVVTETIREIVVF